MKFIDKTLKKIAGNSLVDDFLNSRWSKTTNCYSEINYSTDPTHSFRVVRDDVRQLLLDEQQNLCCYCMRIIDDNSATFEHIVPKSTTTQPKLDQYTHFPIIRDNICLQSVFENANTELNTPPFPLEIAYENLVVSCDGRVVDGIPKDRTAKFCNNYRGNNLIEPLFYISTIETDIKYRKAGLLFSTDSTYDASINTLNLNYVSLQRIRQVWYHISVENIVDIENAVTEVDRNTILTVNLMSLRQDVRNQLIADFKTETFWNILLEYKWFYNYFRINYPVVDR